MTVQTETSKTVYIGDGITVKFPVPFRFFEKEVAVYLGNTETPLVEGKDYTVDNISRLETGNIIFVTPPAKGDKITIIRNVPFKQLTTFLEGEDFPAVDFENALDKITMALQQMQERLSRFVSIPVTEEYTDKDLLNCFSMLTQNFKILENLPLMIDEVRNMYLEILNKYYSAEEIDTMLQPLTTLRYKNVAVEINNETLEAATDCPGFPYKLNIALEGAVSDKIPHICFNGTDATSGRFSSVAKSYDGGVTLYVSRNEAYTSVIPIILLQ